MYTIYKKIETCSLLFIVYPVLNRFSYGINEKIIRNEIGDNLFENSENYLHISLILGMMYAIFRLSSCILMKLSDGTV